MDKLEKPKFFTTPIWGNISIVLSILVCFTFSKHISDILIFIIIVGLILIFLLWNLIKYIISWNKIYKNYLIFYQNYQELLKKHSALANQFDKRGNKLKELNSLLDEYKYTLKIILFHIEEGITPVNEYETKYLENLLKISLKAQEHLYNLEGGNNNE